ncbi:MAG: hypothetical protein M3N13_03955, partial [Candidatus Eremiobacteraeota bacterium]|nr:hypothetical protein [Candidatus Eremiobacteraeota bacterium]
PAAKSAGAGTIIYPDGSIQLADARGNFDASQSAWTITNIAALAADPSMQPIVDVVVPAAAGAVPLPEEISVNAYAPAAGRVPLEESMRPSSIVPELATVSIAPRSSWLEDGHARMFTIRGSDTSNAAFPLDRAQVQWSVGRAKGCGAALGSILTLPADASKAVYKAPATGYTSPSCPDQITASLTNGSAVFSATSSAYVYDPKMSAQLAGVLQDASGKPVAGAVIDLYAAGADAVQGSLLVGTDSQGRFARTVPSTRTLNPVVASVVGGRASFRAVAPSSINPVAAGSQLAKQIWKLASAAQAKTTQPAFATVLRDASLYGTLMHAKFPLDTPDAVGKFAVGTVESILASPVSGGSGKLSAGVYRNYSYTWDASGKTATFVQPVPAGSEQHSFAVTIGAAVVGSATCVRSVACFSFVEKLGPALVSSGAWSSNIANGRYTLALLSNHYNAAHQALGHPIYSDSAQSIQVLGSNAAANLTIVHADAKGKQLAAIASSRTPASAPALFNYNGTVQSFAYGANGSPVETDYALNSGVENEDAGGSYAFVVSRSPSSANVGMSIAWKDLDALSASSANVRANGTIDIAGQSGLASGHAASFSIDRNEIVHLVLDAGLGGSTLTFQL